MALQEWKAFHLLHRDVWQEVDVYASEDGKPDGIFAETEMEAARIVHDYIAENYAEKEGPYLVRVYRVMEKDPCVKWDAETLARAEKYAKEEAGRIKPTYRTNTGRRKP